VATEPTSGTKHRFVLKKPDVVTAARDMLQGSAFSAADEDGRFLVSQQSFRTPEGNRVRAALAEPSDRNADLEHDLIAAIREAAQRGEW